MNNLNKLVCEFAQEMNSWESAFHTAWKEVFSEYVHGAPDEVMAIHQAKMDAVQSAFQLKYKEIFERYCTQRKRVYGGPESPRSARFPTKYAGVNEASFISTELPTKSRAEVTFQTNGQPVDYQFLFVLLRKGDKWLVDAYKEKCEGEAKWSSGLL
jgi:hypothetical protein